MYWYTKPKSMFVKKLELSLIFFSVICFSGISQTIDFTSKVDSSKNGEKYQYTISVTLKTNLVNCSISLFEFTPNKNYKLIDSKVNTGNIVNTFVVYDRRKWMVTVESGNLSKSKIIK